MPSQGGLSIQWMCELAGVSRASFYRNWKEREPPAAEMALRDAIQRAALTHRHYGYARSYRTMEELAQHLEEFIEQVYNRVRLHSALGYQSPVEFERQQAVGSQ